MPYRIERLRPPVPDADIRALARLLADTVNSGSAVSFLAPLGVADAEAWWRGLFAEATPRTVILVARDDAGITGTVQLHPAWAPNQPHRGDIAKLMVDRSARGAGLGARLMEAIEREARAVGCDLLVLDTREGDAAERLYTKLGWTRVGVIPRYALDPDGASFHGTVLFYKELAAPRGT